MAFECRRALASEPMFAASPAALNIHCVVYIDVYGNSYDHQGQRARKGQA